MPLIALMALMALMALIALMAIVKHSPHPIVTYLICAPVERGVSYPQP